MSMISLQPPKDALDGAPNPPEWCVPSEHGHPHGEQHDEDGETQPAAFDSFSSTGIPLRIAGTLSTGRAKLVAVVSKDTVVSPTAVDAPSNPPTVTIRYWSAAPAGARPGRSD